jgi:hypothetical protein
VFRQEEKKQIEGRKLFENCFTSICAKRNETDPYGTCVKKISLCRGHARKVRINSGRNAQAQLQLTQNLNNYETNLVLHSIRFVGRRAWVFPGDFPAHSRHDET